MAGFWQSRFDDLEDLLKMNEKSPDQQQV
jgi:hypothetical protein